MVFADRLLQLSDESGVSIQAIRAAVRRLAELRNRDSSRGGSATAQTEFDAGGRMGRSVDGPQAATGRI